VQFATLVADELPGCAAVPLETWNFLFVDATDDPQHTHSAQPVTGYVSTGAAWQDKTHRGGWEQEVREEEKDSGGEWSTRMG
jgi:hypothetical protein